jgi:hypothetical protein
MKMRGPHKIQAQMQYFRASLMVLTGADQGTSQENWLKWWNDNKQKLEVGPKPHEMQKQMQNLWDGYWGEGKAAERETKRGERGERGERGKDGKGEGKDGGKGEGKDDPEGKGGEKDGGESAFLIVSA